MPIEQRHIRTKHSGSSAVCHSVAATGNRLVTDCRGFRARYVLYSLPSHGSSWKLRLRPPLLQLCARPSPRLRQAEHTSCKRSAQGVDSTCLQQGRHRHPSLSLLDSYATRNVPWLASDVSGAALPLPMIGLKQSPSWAGPGTSATHTHL